MTPPKTMFNCIVSSKMILATPSAKSGTRNIKELAFAEPKRPEATINIVVAMVCPNIPKYKREAQNSLSC